MKRNPNSAKARQQDDLKQFQLLSGRRDWSKLPPMVGLGSQRASTNFTATDKRLTSQFLVGAGIGDDGVYEVPDAPPPPPPPDQEPPELQDVEPPEQDLLDAPNEDPQPVPEPDFPEIEAGPELAMPEALDAPVEFAMAPVVNEDFSTQSDTGDYQEQDFSLDLQDVTPDQESVEPLVDSTGVIDVAADYSQGPVSFAQPELSLDLPASPPAKDKTIASVTKSETKPVSQKQQKQKSPSPKYSLRATPQSVQKEAAKQQQPGKPKPGVFPKGTKDTPIMGAKLSGRQEGLPKKPGFTLTSTAKDIPGRKQVAREQAQGSNSMGGVDLSGDTYEAIVGDTHASFASQSANATVDVVSDLVNAMERTVDGLADVRVRIRDILNQLDTMGL